MTRIGAHALATYVGGLREASVSIDSLTETMPRMFVHDEHRVAMRAATDRFLTQARAGADLLRGTDYERAAGTALEDAARAIDALGRPSRGNAQTLANSLQSNVDTLADEVTETRRSVWNERITGGEESLAAARAELVDAIDVVLAPGADGIDVASADVVGDALRSTSWRIPAPHLDVSRPATDLLAEAGDDPRAMYDLQRVLGTWRATLVDSYEPGSALAERAQALVARGADDMAPADWVELQRLIDTDPAGAFVRGPRTVPETRRPVEDVLYEASRREAGAPASWNEHVLVESTSLALGHADADLGALRREARALLKQDPSGFGDRQWARLAELARLDPRHRVLPDRESVTLRDALVDAVDMQSRTSHPRELVPSGRSYGDQSAIALAELWKSHLFGIGSRLRLHIADGGLDTLIRGVGKIEAGLGEAIETGIPQHATDGQALRAIAGRIGLSIGRGIGRGVREGVDAITSRPISGEQLTTALEGGSIPARLSIAELRRRPEWRSASQHAQVSLIARLVARQQPVTMAQSREFIANVRRVPVDEAVLSPQARRAWREVRAITDREDQSLRAVGELREGYVGHLDYASVGRVKSTLELIGTELAMRAKRDAATAAATARATTTAAPPAAASVTTPGTSAAPPIEAAADDAPWGLVDDAGAAESAATSDVADALDEHLVW
ncbi:MAG: hypothetical protein JWL76_1150 [Thermoleophilia bacterium]|nr:hypothetical protein [Thermoleophilia bacterium]